MVTPTALYSGGFTDIISVIPPDAPLSPTSKIPLDQRGKAPGRRLSNGTWRGYRWSKHNSTLEDAKRWAQDGANIGILSAWFPGLDIDILEEWLSNEVAKIARATLGPAPSRVGRAPKQLLMYRTGEPFARMAIVIYMDGKRHLIEMLGTGRQYVIFGQHPSGSRYTWDRELTDIDPTKDLTQITREDVLRFFDRVEELIGALPGVTIERVGEGKIRDRDTNQDELLAPSLDVLSECVQHIPNQDDLFPDREAYIKMGEAIHAGGGDDANHIFYEWASRHERDGRVAGNPTTWQKDWQGFAPPHSVGWTWLAELATPFGFNAAAHEFGGEAPPVVAPIHDEGPPRYSDRWLADYVLEEAGHLIRYVAATRKWYVWHEGRWEPDAMLRAEHLIGVALEHLAAILMRQGATEKEKAANERLAKTLCSERQCASVRSRLQRFPEISTSLKSFDSNIWVLNTPAGIVDLKTGDMREHDPDELCSKATLVAPDYEMPTPEWDRFLTEATGGDIELQLYLQKLAGYALTGSIREHVLPFIWGPGGNGKGTLLNTLYNIAHDYAVEAPMETFVASKYDRHPTELAGLIGARLVTSRETQSGRKWNEQRVKLLTGGDPIRTRFMRQDFFTYPPQFTLIFIGNNRPGIDNLDDAFRRRVHLIPFTVKPKELDLLLDEKLRKEYAGILAWMVRGCVLWQREGLKPPPVVLAATEEYFVEEDQVQRWLEESCTLEGDEWVSIRDLYNSWTQWMNERGERPGSVRRLSQTLVTKGHPKELDSKTRKSGFRGITVIEPLFDETAG